MIMMVMTLVMMMVMVMVIMMMVVMMMVMIVTWKPVAEVISGQRPWIAVRMDAATSKEGRTWLLLMSTITNHYRLSECVMFICNILLILKFLLMSILRLTWWKLYSVAAKERKVEAWLCTIDKTCNDDDDEDDSDDFDPLC